MQAGASDATFGTAVGSGTDAKVAITADTCSNKTVAANTTCALTLIATPDFFGPAQDLITLPDGGAGRKIPVTVDGYDTATGAYTPLPRPACSTPEGPRGHDDDADRRRQVRRPAGDRQRRCARQSGASAVVLNVTVVGRPAAGSSPCTRPAAARPSASSVNFNAGWTGANLVTVEPRHRRQGAGLQRRGSTHVVVDVMGYYHGAASTVTAGYGGYSGHRADPGPRQPAGLGSALPGEYLPDAPAQLRRRRQQPHQGVRGQPHRHQAGRLRLPGRLER